MFYRLPSAISLPFPVTLCLHLLRRKSQHWRRHRTSIHILDDDSLLNIFDHCRPVLLDEDENDERRIIQGGEWGRARWWYKLAHVCRRWRHVILASSSYLDLCLVSTYGTPVADMLAHSPPLPLIIDYLSENHKVNPEDEEGILLAFQHRDRVRRIRLRMPTANLQKLLVAMDGEFSVMEFLYIASPNKHRTTLALPNTLRAPLLLHIGLENFAFPIHSPLLMTAIGLTTLSLHNILPSAYSSPGSLLQQFSAMPQLETLEISFHSPVPSRDVRQHLLDSPIMTPVILPSLRWFGFQGVSAYLDALLSQIIMPLLEKLQVVFFNQLSFTVPHLLQFMSMTENLHSKSAKFWFQQHAVIAATFPHEGAKRYTFYLHVMCRPFDWQVATAAQIFNMLGPVFVAVEHLTFHYQEHELYLDRSVEVDRTLWRELLKSFSNTKTLVVADGLIEELSRSLRVDHGESPLELLPRLHKLVCREKSHTADAFRPYIKARHAAGRPSWTSRCVEPRVTRVRQMDYHDTRHTLYLDVEI